MFHLFSSRRKVKASKRNRRQSPPLAVDQLEARDVPSLLGNQLFPADNPWNQKITNAPVAANSNAIIQHIIDRRGAGTNPRLHPDFGNPVTDGALYGIPWNLAAAGNPQLINFVIDAYAGESDIQPVTFDPTIAVIEGDYPTGPAPHNQRGDSHLLIYDAVANKAYEFYNASRPSENTDGRWHADQESVWDMTRDSFRQLGWTSADAAGLPILPGLARPDEALPVSAGGQGVITHALRMTLHDTLNQYVYPASHEASSRTGSNLPAMGTRFRLKASFVIPANWPAEDKVIAQAMKDYGLILADNGSDMYFTGAPSDLWNDNDLNLLKNIRASNFEVVNLTPVVTGVAPNRGPAAGGTSVVITGLNFSGAAGNLHVYFGSTAATSFTINSDSQITAVSPHGSAGTVNIAVQSGGFKTDDNGHRVFWGYGTSHVTAADQFTYTASASRLIVATVPGGPPTAAPATVSPGAAQGSQPTREVAAQVYAALSQQASVPTGTLHARTAAVSTNGWQSSGNNSTSTQTKASATNDAPPPALVRKLRPDAGTTTLLEIDSFFAIVAERTAWTGRL